MNKIGRICSLYPRLIVDVKGVLGVRRVIDEKEIIYLLLCHIYNFSHLLKLRL